MALNSVVLLVAAIITFWWSRSLKAAWLDGDKLCFSNYLHVDGVSLLDVAAVYESSTSKTVIVEFARKTYFGAWIRLIPVQKRWIRSSVPILMNDLHEAITIAHGREEIDTGNEIVGRLHGAEQTLRVAGELVKRNRDAAKLAASRPT
jgi:hypothetical protein